MKTFQVPFIIGNSEIKEVNGFEFGWLVFMVYPILGFRPDYPNGDWWILHVP